MSCRYPTGRARSTRTSCPSTRTPSATMFSAAAASPPPPSPTYLLPLPPSPTPSHPPFTGTVLCHLAVRRCWAARASAGPTAGRSGRTGPWECRIDTHCAESICFLHKWHRMGGGDGACRQDAEPRGCSEYPIGICRQQTGYPAGYPAGNDSRYPTRISYKVYASSS